MSKRLIYLGNTGNEVRLALVDLDDLTPRTVPVKKVPREEFKKLRNEGKVPIYGAVDSSAEIEDTTYVRVAYIQVTDKLCGVQNEKDKTIYVFISGDGKLRFFHPAYLRDLTKLGHISFVMRQNLIELPVSALMVAKVPEDFTEIYAGLSTRVGSFLVQKLLSYGICGTISYNNSRYVVNDSFYMKLTPLDQNTYNEQNSYDVTIPEFVVPVNCGSLHLSALNLQIDNCYIDNKLTAYSYAGKVVLRKVYASINTYACLLNIRVDKIIGRQTADSNGAISSGKFSNLDVYTGIDMLADAGAIVLENCFSVKERGAPSLVIASDVEIPENASVDRCFYGVKIKGVVRCKVGVQLNMSFNNSECNGVVMEGDYREEVNDRATVYNSFKDTTIHGDVDVQNISRIDDSFTGDILGTVKLNPAFIRLSGNCFTTLADKNFVINTKTAPFKAGLCCSGATLTVNGDRGSFYLLSVDKLIWNTSATKVTEGMFYRATQIMDNTVPSVKELATGAFKAFRGKVLDLRRFPNLEVINPRAINDCENLMVVLITGNPVLKASAFARSPRLAHVYIGDDVQNVPAAAFDNLAPVVNIYYNQNKAVEKLGRIPRFRLHPNSTPEDALRVMEERAERLETASIVATVAGLNVKAGSTFEEQAVYQAVELSLTETGVCANLSERYPIIPKCNKPLKEVVWAYNAIALPRSTIVTHRNEYVQTLVGCIIASYPYCEAVLDFETDNGFVILSSDQYSFINARFCVSGKVYWAYVIVDKATAMIIHAFTIGPERDEINEIAEYIRAIPSGVSPCAVLRYAEELPLMTDSELKIQGDLRLAIHDAIGATWLPFGSFKTGNTNGIYGVDLYTGDCLVYPYLVKAGRGPRGASTSTSSWCTGRLASRAIKYVSDISLLNPLLAGTADENLARIVKASKANLKPIQQFDTTKIPLARDLTKAGQLLSLLKDDKCSMSVKQAVDLLLWSELFMKSWRITANLVFADKTVEKITELQDGVITFYRLKGTQLMAAYITEGDKGQWYTTICRLSITIALLEDIIAKSTQVVDPMFNPYHYSLSVMPVPLDIAFLASQQSYISRQDVVNVRPYDTLCLGVSSVSFKACLYMEKSNVFADNTQRKITVLLWFNSLKDAYEAALHFDFVPFAVKSDNLKRAWESIVRLNMAGEVTNGFLQETREALMEGMPDGYMLPGNGNQELFDLACKQPKTV